MREVSLTFVLEVILEEWKILWRVEGTLGECFMREVWSFCIILGLSLLLYIKNVSYVLNQYWNCNAFNWEESQCHSRWHKWIGTIRTMIKGGFLFRYLISCSDLWFYFNPRYIYIYIYIIFTSIKFYIEPLFRCNLPICL